MRQWVVRLGLLLSALPLNARAGAEPMERPPQFVLISFDGSSSHNFWRETLALSEKAHARFSYFISGVYFVRKENRNQYEPPHHKVGYSDIGFANGEASDIEGRTQFIQTAISRGFDIGSHVNGHFDGKTWTREEWKSEFQQFHKFVEKVFDLNPDLHAIPNWESQLHKELRGFRAPLLAENKGTQQVLKDFNYLYDASQTARFVWPTKMDTGVWNLGLGQIPLLGTKHQTIAMDYNILYGQCNGRFNPKNAGECAELSSGLLEYFENQMYMTYLSAFLKSYYGNRAPISIGHHFSLWNKGIYWKALQRAVYDMCSQPEVQCVTHKDLVNWLEQGQKEKGPKFLTQLNQAQFSKVGVPKTVAENIKIDPAFLKSVADKADLILPELSPETQRMMLKGDLPQAHMNESNDDDLGDFRFTPKGS